MIDASSSRSFVTSFCVSRKELLKRHLRISTNILTAEMLKIALATVRSLKDLEANTVTADSETAAVGLSNIPEDDIAAALTRDATNDGVSSTATQHSNSSCGNSFDVQPPLAAVQPEFLPEDTTISSGSGGAQQGGCTVEDPLSEDEPAPTESGESGRTMFRIISRRRGFSRSVPVDAPMAGVSEESVEAPSWMLTTKVDGEDMAALVDTLEQVCKEVRCQSLMPGLAAAALLVQIPRSACSFLRTSLVLLHCRPCFIKQCPGLRETIVRDVRIAPLQLPLGSPLMKSTRIAGLSARRAAPEQGVRGEATTGRGVPLHAALVRSARSHCLGAFRNLLRRFCCPLRCRNAPSCSRAAR